MVIPYERLITRWCTCGCIHRWNANATYLCPCGNILTELSDYPPFNIRSVYAYADKYRFACPICYDMLDMTQEFAEGISPSTTCSTCNAIYILRDGQIIQDGFSEYKPCPLCGDPWPSDAECRKVKQARAEGKL